jgi:hypothetical protein
MADRATRKRLARRRVMPGYPKSEPFLTPEALAAYFAADRVTCLLCGKSYRALGVHVLTIHHMEPDDYRSKFGIPWTYGLNGEHTRELHAALARENRRMGIFKDGTAEWLREMMAQRGPQRQRTPASDELARRNLAKMNAEKSGRETRRRNLCAKWGSEEWRAKLRARPFHNKDWFPTWWKGKTQAPEHVAKRIASGLATRARNRSAGTASI